MNHGLAHDLLPDFALGLLEPEEAGEVAAHVAGCDICRPEFQRLVQASDALAMASPLVEVPTGAAERIAAEVRQRTSTRTLAPPISIVEAREKREGGWRMLALVSAAGFLVVALALTAVAIAWIGAQDDVDELERQVAELEDELGQRPFELALSGEGGTGTIWVSPDFTGGVGHFENLGNAPDGHHYHVWSQGPEGTISAAEFEEGGETLVALPPLPSTMTRMFVTLEPDGAAGEVPEGPELLSTP